MDSFRVKAAFLGGVAAAAKRYAPQAASMLTRGLGGELKRQVGFGAAVGGALEGGMGALGAEKGHKLEAFGRGALHGAAVGGAMGAATAPIATAGRNMRLKALESMGGTPAAAKATVDRGYFKGIKDLATGSGPMGRRGAALETLAAPVQTAAEFAIPAAAVGALESRMQPEAPQLPLPQQQKQAEDAAAGFQFEPAYISPFTSMAGKGLTDSLVEKLHPEMSHGFFRKRALPALGAAALTIPAVKAIRAMNPEPAPLDDIDVDALKYYFGKPPQTPG
jgi:hypothetical protein